MDKNGLFPVKMPTKEKQRAITLADLENFFITLPIVPIITPTTGRIFYVSATGNDGNIGMTAAQPWLTITKVNAQSFLPGDSVLFKSGDTWSGTSLIVPSSGRAGAYITFSNYGVGANPIINKAADYGIRTNSKSYLVFDGIDGTAGSRNYYVFDSTYVIIKNADLKATTLEESSININGTNDTSCHHIIIDNCNIHDTPGWAISAGNSLINYLTVRNCTVTNIGDTNGTVQHHAIYTTNCKNVLVEYCTIDNSLNAGVVIKALTGKTCSGTVRRCKITRAGQGGAVEVGIGISLDGVEWAILENNHIQDGSTVAPGAGIRVSQNASGIPSTNVQIYNNTIVRNYVGIGLSPGDTGFIIKNNLVMQDFAWAAANARVCMKLETSAEVAANTWNNNLYWFKNGAGSKDPVDVAGTQETFAAWKARASSPDASGLSVDPLLVTEYTNLHLQSGSSARNAGANIGANSTTDRDGITLDSIPDLGCYQYV